MGLIDADALKDMMLQAYNDALPEFDMPWKKKMAHSVTLSFMADIDEAPTVDAVPVVRCVECKYRYVDGDNVRFNLCLLNHNKVQSDDWYCADGRRKDAWEPNETDLKAMLDAGHETFVRVFSQDAKMNKEVE